MHLSCGFPPIEQTQQSRLCLPCWPLRCGQNQPICASMIRSTRLFHWRRRITSAALVHAWGEPFVRRPLGGGARETGLVLQGKEVVRAAEAVMSWRASRGAAILGIPPISRMPIGGGSEPRRTRYCESWPGIYPSQRLSGTCFFTLLGGYRDRGTLC